MATPDWVSSPVAAPAPSYEQLLAQARLKMMDVGGYGIPTPPAQPGPSSWADIGLMGAGERAADDRVKDLPPGLRRVFDRLPADMQERLLDKWANRGGGFSPRQGADREGGRDRTGPQFGLRADGSPDSGAPAGNGTGFGSGEPWGPGWGKGAAVVGGMVNPVLGLGLEGMRRGSNVGLANELRGKIGIEGPGVFGDFFGALGAGKPSGYLGDLSFGGVATPVTWGGGGRGDDSYGPYQAMEMSWNAARDRARHASAGKGGPRDGGGGGGWGESGSFSGREDSWDDDRGYGVG